MYWIAALLPVLLLSFHPPAESSHRKTGDYRELNDTLAVLAARTCKDVLREYLLEQSTLPKPLAERLLLRAIEKNAQGKVLVATHLGGSIAYQYNISFPSPTEMQLTCDEYTAYPRHSLEWYRTATVSEIVVTHAFRNLKVVLIIPTETFFVEGKPVRGLLRRRDKEDEVYFQLISP